MRNFFLKCSLVLCGVAAACLPAPAFAQMASPVDLAQKVEDAGIDTTINSAIGVLLTLAGLAIAGYAVFMLIRAGMRWMRTAVR